MGCHVAPVTEACARPPPREPQCPPHNWLRFVRSACGLSDRPGERSRERKHKEKPALQDRAGFGQAINTVKLLLCASASASWHAFSFMFSLMAAKWTEWERGRQAERSCYGRTLSLSPRGTSGVVRA